MCLPHCSNRPLTGLPPQQHSLAHVGAAHFGVIAVAVLLHAAGLAALAALEVGGANHLHSSSSSMWHKVSAGEPHTLLKVVAQGASSAGAINCPVQLCVCGYVLRVQQL